MDKLHDTLGTDYRTNAQITKELKITPILEKNYWNTREAGYNM